MMVTLDDIPKTSDDAIHLCFMVGIQIRYKIDESDIQIIEKDDAK